MKTEAAAAETAGIEMVVCLASAVPAVREGSRRVFVTAAIDFGGAVTLDELLATALQALIPAEVLAVITTRTGLATISLGDSSPHSTADGSTVTSPLIRRLVGRVLGTKLVQQQVLRSF